MSINAEETIRKFNSAFLTLESLKKQNKTMFDATMANGQVVAVSTSELDRALGMFTRDGRTPNLELIANQSVVDKNQRLIFAILAAASLKK